MTQAIVRYILLIVLFLPLCVSGEDGELSVDINEEALIQAIVQETKELINTLPEEGQKLVVNEIKLGNYTVFSTNP